MEGLSDLQCRVRTIEQLNFLQKQLKGKKLFPRKKTIFLPEARVQYKKGEPWKRIYKLRFKEDKKKTIYQAEVDIYTGNIIDFKKAPKKSDQVQITLQSPEQLIERKKQEYLKKAEEEEKKLGVINPHIKHILFIDVLYVLIAYFMKWTLLELALIISIANCLLFVFLLADLKYHITIHTQQYKGDKK